MDLHLLLQTEEPSLLIMSLALEASRSKEYLLFIYRERTS